MSKIHKKRFCPAIGRDITSGDCGEGRNSRFNCPAECPFNPLAPANYSQLLELEERVDEEALRWLSLDAKDPLALARSAQKATSSTSPHALHSLIVWNFFFEKDATGRTCAERWEQAGFPGLKNDARVLARAKRSMSVGLIEVHRVLNDERTEVVDLLSAEPKPFIVTDRGLASSVARFSTALSWIYPLPHFHRLFGSAIMVQEVSQLEPRETVEGIVRHLGGPTEEAGMRRWLAEHFLRFEEALQAVAVERRRLMFASMDAKFGKAVYELKGPFAVCRDRLDQVAEVAEDSLLDGERAEGFAEARVWFAKDDDPVFKTAPNARGVLGRALLGQSHWRLEAIGGEKLAALRGRFEAQMTRLAQFTGERLDDVAGTMAERDPKVDRSLVPPQLLENPNQILMTSSRVPATMGDMSPEDLREELYAAHERAFLDDAIPALDGRTPREAAGDPALRPKLIRLMKSRVRQCDEENLETGSNRDVNWMLRELGLEEILFDPPPKGRVPERACWQEGGETAEDEFVNECDETIAEMDPDLPPAPPLPNRPFTLDEVAERLQTALNALEGPSEALNELAEGGCTLVDDVLAVTEGLVDDYLSTFLFPFVAQVWFVFAPPGTRASNVTRANLQTAIERETEDFLEALGKKTPEAVDQYLQSGPQPSLVQTMMGMVLNVANFLSPEHRPSVEKQALIVAVLRAVIAEINSAHRRR